MADNPAWDQPAVGRTTFHGHSFVAEQEDTSIDLMTVAIKPPNASVTNGGSTYPDPTQPPLNVFETHTTQDYYTGFVLAGPLSTDGTFDALPPSYFNPLEAFYGSPAAMRLGPAGACAPGTVEGSPLHPPPPPTPLC